MAEVSVPGIGPPAKISEMMQEDDIQALRTAVAALEHPRLAARLAEIAGKPIELFSRALPQTASKAIAVASTQALNTSHHAERAESCL
jgi:hypothetical protein